MPTMPDRVHSAFEAEMYDARCATSNETRWDHLELAHLMTESYAWPHVRTHLAMLGLALRTRDRGAAGGQVAALVSVVTSRGGHGARCRAHGESRQAQVPFAPWSR